MPIITITKGVVRVSNMLRTMDELRAVTDNDSLGCFELSPRQHFVQAWRDVQLAMIRLRNSRATTYVSDRVADLSNEDGVFEEVNVWACELEASLQREHDVLLRSLNS